MAQCEPLAPWEYQMRFLRYEDLKPLGIPFSRVHIDRLQRAGKFPKKVKLGPNTATYVKEEVLAWLDARIAERDGAAS